MPEPMSPERRAARRRYLDQALPQHRASLPLSDERLAEIRRVRGSMKAGSFILAVDDLLAEIDRLAAEVARLADDNAIMVQLTADHFRDAATLRQLTEPSDAVVEAMAKVLLRKGQGLAWNEASDIFKRVVMDLARAALTAALASARGDGTGVS